MYKNNCRRNVIRTVSYTECCNATTDTKFMLYKATISMLQQPII